MRPFSKEERKEWFAQKRNEIKAKFKEQQKKSAKEGQDDEEASDAGDKEDASQNDSDAESEEDFLENNKWAYFNEEKEALVEEKGCDKDGRCHVDSDTEEVYGEDLFQFLFNLQVEQESAAEKFAEKMSEDT